MCAYSLQQELPSVWLYDAMRCTFNDYCTYRMAGNFRKFRGFGAISQSFLCEN